VPIKDFRELETSYAGAQQTIQEREAQLAELASELERSEAGLVALQGQLDELNAALSRKREALEHAQAKEAELVASQGRLQADVESMRQALAEMESRRDAAERRLAAYRDLLARFQKLIDAGKLQVKIVDGRMVVELATDVLFSSGSAELSADGRAAIQEVAQVLASIPRRTFQVEGHTDDDPIHTAQYPSNWELAAGRALTVVEAMIEAGMPAPRISAASYGEHKPSADNQTEEGQAINRRIEIVVVPDLSGLPGYDELQQVGTGPAPDKQRRKRD